MYVRNIQHMHNGNQPHSSNYQQVPPEIRDIPLLFFISVIFVQDMAFVGLFAMSAIGRIEAVSK